MSKKLKHQTSAGICSYPLILLTATVECINVKSFTTLNTAIKNKLQAITTHAGFLIL